MSVHAVGRNFLINGLGTVVQRLGTLGLMAVYTRFLSTEEFGLYALVQLYVFTLSPLVISCTSGAIQRLSVDYHGTEKPRLIGNVAIVLLSVGTLVLGVTGLWGGPAIQTIFDVQASEAQAYFVFGQLALYAFLFISLHTGVFQAEGRPSRIVRIQVLQGLVIFLVGVYYVVLANGGVAGAVSALVIGNWLIVPVILWDLWGRVALRPNRKMLISIAAFSFPVVPYVALSLAKDATDRIVLAQFGGLDAVGIYAVALMVSMICGLTASTYYAAFGPAIFRVYKERGIPRGQEEVRRRAMQGLVLVLLTFVVLSSFSAEIIAILADAQYHRAAELVPVISGAFIARYLWLLSYYHIMHILATRLLPLISAGGLLVTIGLAIPLTLTFGAVGAAVGFAGGFICMALVGALISRRLGFRSILSWKQAALLIGAATAIVGVAVTPSYTSLVQALSVKAVGCVGFLALAWRVGLFDLHSLAALRLPGTSKLG